MCGICLILNLPINNHHFSWNFLEAYQPDADAQPLPLNEHILHHKLTMPPPQGLLPAPKVIASRGPHSTTAHRIDMFKTNYHQVDPEQVSNYVEPGMAVGVQSALHLRGKSSYVPSTPGSYFLFNGEMWDTGSLPPVAEGQNDSEWLHHMLMGCNGSEERMLDILAEVRGDYSIILVEGNHIYVMKDYFGKRSLLLGMGEEHLYLTSMPLVEATQQEPPPEADDEQEDNNWKAKYQAEWLSSKHKMLFEVPANSFISIQLRNSTAMWTHQPIHSFDLKKLSLEKQPDAPENVVATVKKLLVECVKELTRSIRPEEGQVTQQGEARVAVLFSGGVDSTLIARLLDLALPKDQAIDLVNLAFREDAPDREAARISFEELHQLNPNRRFNLILVNRSLDDVEKVKRGLLQAIYPKSTHMDFNIATALHLASAATPASIILSGLGADEIFAGYSRYRIAYKRAGYQEMENEMLFDMGRLWIRNMGRDDRAIGMNGKEVRYPFLYLPLWLYLRQVPLPVLTEGNGEKMLLRKVARDFGLERASTFKKRAIQFGTRLAKLSNVKSFGSNRKAKGTYEYH